MKCQGFNDGIWEVIRETVRKYDGYDLSEEHRKKLEEILEITSFDGGCFVAYGNGFDLFVLPERQGKWRIRSIFGKYLDDMHKKHGVIRIGIDDRNEKSLRLAKHFGFVEVERNGIKIKLEKSWAI